jgi:hypothetical protein
MVMENRVQYSLMANNSDAERTSTSPPAVARKRRFVWRFVWWAGSVALLIALAVLAPWLASRRFSFSAGWFLPLVLAAVAILAVLILWLPQWQVAHVRGLEPKDRFDRVNDARKTLATILGGIVLLAGFFGTWQNLKVAQESASISQKALLVSQEGQITDRFTKAIETAGSGVSGWEAKAGCPFRWNLCARAHRE